MIMSMPPMARLQHRYDHRLRNLVQRTGNATIATSLGVPRSTVRGWLGKAPEVVVSLDVTDLSAPALHQEVLELRRRVKKLTALLRLALVLLRCSTSGCSFTRRTASPPSVDGSRSMSTNTTACFRIQRFADRRRTRCTSGRGTHCRQT